MERNHLEQRVLELSPSRSVLPMELRGIHIPAFGNLPYGQIVLEPEKEELDTANGARAARLRSFLLQRGCFAKERFRPGAVEEARESGFSLFHFAGVEFARRMALPLF